MEDIQKEEWVRRGKESNWYLPIKDKKCPSCSGKLGLMHIDYHNLYAKKVSVSYYVKCLECGKKSLSVEIDKERYDCGSYSIVKKEEEAALMEHCLSLM